MCLFIKNWRWGEESCTCDHSLSVVTLPACVPDAPLLPPCCRPTATWSASGRGPCTGWMTNSKGLEKEREIVWVWKRVLGSLSVCGVTLGFQPTSTFVCLFFAFIFFFYVVYNYKSVYILYLCSSTDSFRLKKITSCIIEVHFSYSAYLPLFFVFKKKS